MVKQYICYELIHGNWKALPLKTIKAVSEQDAKRLFTEMMLDLLEYETEESAIDTYNVLFQNYMNKEYVSEFSYKNKTWKVGV